MPLELALRIEAAGGAGWVKVYLPPLDSVVVRVTLPSAFGSGFPIVPEVDSALVFSVFVSTVFEGVLSPAGWTVAELGQPVRARTAARKRVPATVAVVFRIKSSLKRWCCLALLRFSLILLNYTKYIRRKTKCHYVL